MAAKSEATLISDIAAAVLSGGRRTTAANVRALLADILDSYANIVDGGQIYQAEVGYSSVFNPTQNTSFVTKKWVEDNFVALGGIGSLSQTLAVGNTTGGYNIVLSGTDVIADSSSTVSFLDLNNQRLYFFDGFNRFALQSDLSSGIIELNARDMVSVTLEHSYVQALVNGVNIGCYSQTTGNETKLNFGTIYSEISSTYASYTGLTYAADYSSNYTSRSLVDKGYIDGLIYDLTGIYQPLDADLTSWAAITRAAGFDTFVASPSSLNLKSLITDETGSGALVFGTSPTFTTDITTPLIIGGSAVGSNITYKSTSGTGTTTAAAHTFTGGTNGGTTIATLYNNGNFSIGNYASPNNLRLVTIGQDTAWLSIGSRVGSTSSISFYANQATPSATNFNVDFTQTDTTINAPSSTGGINLQFANNTRVAFLATDTGYGYTAKTTGSTITYRITMPADTGQTASTEIPNFKVTGSTKTWAAGAITTQRWNYLTANTAAFASLSTITNSYGLYVEAATAGTKATITNNWAIGTNGGIFLNGTADTVLGNAALATNATTGFLHVPSCAGTPTGVPTLYTGMIPVCVDSTNNKMYIYSGGAWVALN